MSISLVVAAAQNDVIGARGDLPWRLPNDLRRFAAVTQGSVVVMGRRTHESILVRLGRSLPGRHSIVITSRLLLDVEVAKSPEAAIDRAAMVTADLGRQDWFVVGGARVYEALLPVVDVIELTRVHIVVEGDTRMPLGWLAPFDLVSEHWDPLATVGPAHSFQRWARRR